MMEQNAMNLNDIKLIASDLDGTILLNGATSLPEGFCDLILKLKEQGIIFAAASGRQYYSLRRLFEPVKDEIAYICENGALTIYKDEVIQKLEIPDEICRAVIPKLLAEEGTEPLVSGMYKAYIQPKTNVLHDRLQSMGNNYAVVPDLLDIGEPVIKIALFEDAGTEDGLRLPYWQSKFDPPVKVVTSGAKWLDLLLPNIHKGAGIDALSRHLGITSENILCFGDNLNDLEMFDASGVRVAVAEAKPEIVEIADYHVDMVENFLTEHILKNSKNPD